MYLLVWGFLKVRVPTLSTSFEKSAVARTGASCIWRQIAKTGPARQSISAETGWPDFFGNPLRVGNADFGVGLRILDRSAGHR